MIQWKSKPRLLQHVHQDVHCPWQHKTILVLPPPVDPQNKERSTGEEALPWQQVLVVCLELEDVILITFQIYADIAYLTRKSKSHENMMFNFLPKRHKNDAVTSDG